MLLTGAALLIGALAGNRDPLQPLAGLRGTAVAAEEKKPTFEPVRSLAENGLGHKDVIRFRTPGMTGIAGSFA